MSNIDLSLDEKNKFESRFIPSAVFDNNQSTDPAREQAFILGELYHKVVEKHHQLEFKLLVAGGIFILIGIIVIVWGIISGQDIYIIGGIIIIILAVLILIYGFYIHKPKKLVFLSKVYTVSHFIPFEPALIIDGTDVVPDQTLHYKDIPLNEYVTLSQKLPTPPITFDKEQQLITVMKEKQKLLKDIHSFSLPTPALLKNDAYTQAVIECLEISQSGESNYGVLNMKVDYETALEHTSKIKFFSELESSVSIINQDSNIMKERADPFIKNLEAFISNIDIHFKQVIILLNDHFFSGININGNPKDDKMYGYGTFQHKYHIPVGNSLRDPALLNPVQHVIDILDDTAKEAISTIIRNSERSIDQRNRDSEDRIQLTIRTFDSQIDQLKTQIDTKLSEIRPLSSQVDMYENQAREYRSQAREYENEANLAMSGQYPDQNLANQCRMNSNEAYIRARNAASQCGPIRIQINNINHRIDQLKSSISNLEIQRNSEIESTKRKAEKEINQMKNELKEDIRRSRAHIEPIIEARDKVINIMERVVKDIIPQEHDSHKRPFKNRLNIIQDLLNHNLSEMQMQVNERSKVLEQIDSIKIDIPIKKPISIKIPYWIACLSGNDGTEYIVLPLQRSQKPIEPLKGRKTVSILTTLFQSLESSKHYLQKDSLCKESASYSIYPGKLAPGISSAFDELYRSGYLSKGIYKRIKKEYNLDGDA